MILIMSAGFHALTAVPEPDRLGVIYQAIIPHSPAHMFKLEFVGEVTENLVIPPVGPEIPSALR